MTLHSHNDFSIPEETARIARAAYPKGNLYMKMRDALGTIYQDESFAQLFPHNGRPVEAPWRLAFMTVVQFIEELPDRQAAEAVRGRIDLKYALGLELSDSGFDFTLLTDFRARLIQGGAEQVLLDAMLTLFKERGWLKERQKQRSDSTHILAKVRAINRLMCVGEAMRFALNSLAVVAGDWLLEHSDVAWLGRYGHRIEERRLPQSQAGRLAAAETIGQDGARLLSDLFDEAAPAFLREIPAVKILRQVWVQNYRYDDGQLHWREPSDIPPAALFINSPYDREARYGKKYSTRWTGYKVRLTEVIQADLQAVQMLPSQHVLDTGYINADVLANSQQRFGIEVVSPAHPDVRMAGQYRAWDRRQSVCHRLGTPAGDLPAREDKRELDADV